MSTLIEAVQTAPLQSDRTIARDLVHRVALEEVFLTDFRSMPDGGFLAAARLPRAHRYYNDHTNRPQLHDPLAVFECVRQMLLCAMHLHHGAPRDTSSITATCTVEITDPDALAIRRGYELELIGTVASSKEREGATTRVVHQVEVRLAGAVVGTISVDTALKPQPLYEGLRMRSRTSPPPLSDQLIAQEPVARIAPHLVGRTDPGNVLLLDPEFAEGVLTARLRVPVSNPGMFDHVHDHVPGPVMMEAARQAGVLFLGELFGRAPHKAVLVELTAQYLQFAELDAEIILRARPAADAGPDAPILLDFVQDDTSVATMQIRMATVLTSTSGELTRAV